MMLRLIQSHAAVEAAAVDLHAAVIYDTEAAIYVVSAALIAYFADAADAIICMLPLLHLTKLSLCT